MTLESRRQYIKIMRMRYKKSTKKAKSHLITELCEVCKFSSRKHAIRILGSKTLAPKRKPGPTVTYDENVKKHLIFLWRKMNFICSKRMKKALLLWLEYYNPEGLTTSVKKKLLNISPASIDRLLRPIRVNQKKGLSSTSPGAYLKSQIPIELLDAHVKSPGYLEADTVVHCGNSLLGQYACTLTMTDLYSAWTENRATWTKRSDVVLEAIQDIRRGLPFKMKGFACDNGSEFINFELNKYLRDHKKGYVKFVRRRPYKKNDACHVEQKNDTHVRRLFGYERLSHPELVDLRSDIYEHYWNPLQNYFMPALKLKRKVRIGGRVKKIYDEPKPPYQRLMESDGLTPLQKQRLEAQNEHSESI